MPDHLGDDMRKTKVEENKEEKEIKGMFLILLILKAFFKLFCFLSTALDERDIEILKTYVSLLFFYLFCYRKGSWFN